MWMKEERKGGGKESEIELGRDLWEKHTEEHEHKKGKTNPEVTKFSYKKTPCLLFIGRKKGKFILKR